MRDTDPLVAEPHEPRHLLIRLRDEPGLSAPVATVEPHQLLVLATPGAHASPSLVDELVQRLRGTRAESVWIAVAGLASAERVRRIADELDVEVVAPDGGVAVVPGAELYAGAGVGGTGWYRCEPGREPVFHGARFSAPEWESWLPADVAGTVGVPCGLVVGDVPGEPGGWVVGEASGGGAFGVPVNRRFPKVVVGSAVPAPETVAHVLGGLPDRPVMLVPAVPGALEPGWLAELARLLGREVVFSAGTQVRARSGAVSTLVPDGRGGRLFRPFALVLRQDPDGGPQEVLDIAAAPPGWERGGPRAYRRDGVLAEVVPSGLVLHSGDADVSLVDAPFDPAGWTLTVGAPGGVIALPALQAAEQLLADLPAEQRAAVTVRLAGTADADAARALDPTPRAHAPQPPVTTTPPRPSAPPPVPTSTPQKPEPPVLPPVVSASPPPVVPPVQPATEPPVTAPPVTAPPVTAPPVTAPPVTAPPVEPPVVEAPTPVVATTSAPPRTTSAPAAQGTSDPAPPKREIPPTPEKEAEPMPADLPRTATSAPPVMTTSGAPVSTVSERAGTPAAPVERADRTIRALEVPARASTAAEQLRFTTAAGDYFSEALATVNAAMATWPAMRVDESSGVKADYVAVCLFLGKGAGDALSLNAALKAGQAGELDAQVACLMSGIRRLPTQRRAVLRQGMVAESLEHRSAPGTVLTEPGFLPASIDLDVTLPGADLDVLIWPSTARRTSELLLGRPVDEALFVAGARFKALAVRTAEDESEEEKEVAAPRVAVLYRELAPGEVPTTSDLDERDLAVLAKLDGVLERRHRNGLRVVDDPEVAARLTTSMVVWQRETATAVAS
ncbi:hypothetical protein ACFPM7_29140 [Actinokineospora guangxiensis]|uniref:Uncharacterized protein n=1 Tax=Actinokineospora guangxiensis TaxID=1490288 RepID=A0ABW0EYE6_9PSEU